MEGDYKDKIVRLACRHIPEDQSSGRISSETSFQHPCAQLCHQGKGISSCFTIPLSAHLDAVGRRFIRALTKLMSLSDRNLLSVSTCFDQSLSSYRKVRSHLLTDIVYWKNALGLSVSWMRFTRSTSRCKYPPADPSMHPRDMTAPRLISRERRHKGNKTRREDAPSPPSATEA
ncbi:hypothetical protein AVEN_218148-1 [Araneus ventricosus]|uniref:Uncharacterized protein n=1 Tax=Araneus ventricosus TaxID=182803 RepID=A0A4Y2SCF8_ARAVE|nr:hypothetical protein AVEN_218148-1 [Araneus ventricosus]